MEKQKAIIIFPDGQQVSTDTFIVALNQGNVSSQGTAGNIVANSGCVIVHAIDTLSKAQGIPVENAAKILMDAVAKAVSMYVGITGNIDSFINIMDKEVEKLEQEK